jgi:spore maturation protein CgeB
MRFLQIHSFYDAYLAGHYAANPQLLDANHETQLKALLADGFGVAHMWAPILAAKGHEAQLVIANDVVSQLRWAEQSLPGLKLKKKSDWLMEIALAQVNHFKPDVLHLGDPVLFDMSFVYRLKQRPKWVTGWRAAPTPDSVNWKGMDLMLSHLDASMKLAWKKQVRDARLFYPGFSRWIADGVSDVSKSYDVVFCGQWSEDHERRNKLIAKIAKASLSKEKPFSFGLFLECADPSRLPEAVRKLNQGSRWGMEMYRTLRQGRIVLNAEIDMARGSAGNMRFFEATGVGSCLLTEHHDNVGRYFEPEKEIVTFKGSDDCLAKLHALVDEPERLDAIAKAGQERCLTEHESGKRMEALLALLESKPSALGLLARRLFHRS